MLMMMYLQATLTSTPKGKIKTKVAPFFLKQYVRSHASNVFEAYPKLLTEMALMRRSQRLVKNPALTSTRPGFTCYASS